MERDNRDEDMMLKGTKQEMPGFYFRLLRSEEKRELWNPDFELLFLLRGTGRVSYEDGEVHSLPVGSVFAINRFQICDLDLDEDGLALSLCISAETIAAFHIKLLKCEVKCQSFFYMENQQEKFDLIRRDMARIFLEMYKNNEEQPVYMKSRVTALLEDLLSYFTSEKKVEQGRSGRERLQRASDYILQHYREEITLEDLADGTNHALASFGYPRRTLEEVRRFVGNGAANLIAQAVPAGRDPAPVLKAFQAYYPTHCRIKTAPYPGVLEALAELREKYPIAIVSNKPDAAVKPLCAHYFPGIFALGETAGCPRKPDPAMVRKAMEAIGVTDCVYVGAYEMPATNLSQARSLISKNQMTDGTRSCPGLLFSKTGWTTSAQGTLVTAARQSGVTLIAVTLKSPMLEDKYQDTQALLEYGFANYKTFRVEEDFVLTQLKAQGLDRAAELTDFEPFTILIPQDTQEVRVIVPGGVDPDSGVTTLPISVAALREDGSETIIKDSLLPLIYAEEASVQAFAPVQSDAAVSAGIHFQPWPLVFGALLLGAVEWILRKRRQN